MRTVSDRKYHKIINYSIFLRKYFNFNENHLNPYSIQSKSSPTLTLWSHLQQSIVSHSSIHSFMSKPFIQKINKNRLLKFFYEHFLSTFGKSIRQYHHYCHPHEIDFVPQPLPEYFFTDHKLLSQKKSCVYLFKLNDSDGNFCFVSSFYWFIKVDIAFHV